MAYSAEITNKELHDGKLRVTIRYSDGVNSHTDTMETRCTQDANWVTKEASARCKELDALITFADSMKTGVVDISTPVPNVPVVDEARALYEKRLNQFNAAQQAMRMGILADSHEAFTNLKTWLVNNFRAEYLDLFI